MAKIIGLPDGSEAEFPDEMSDDAIGEVLRKQFPVQKPAPTRMMAQEMAAQSAESPVTAFNTGIANAATRVGAGLGKVLPQALAKHLPSQADVDLLEAGSEGSVPARVGQIGMDVAATAPLMAGRLVSQAGKMGLYGALTADKGQELQGAAIGAGATAVAPALGAALNMAGRGVRNLLGTTSGAGAEATKQAFKDAPGFVENMRGKVPESNVVESARQGAQTLRDNMKQRYATAKGGWAGDNTPLSLDPIIKEANDTAAKYSFEGMPQPGVTDVYAKVSSILDDWKTQAAKNPAFTTVEGLDALKRHLQDVIPDNVANRTGRAYVTEVVNGVKKAITNQAPKYKEAMEDYWRSSNELDEITRSLSLGNKATTDTALRKLQSLTKPHAGERLTSAAALEQVGADILPQVSGQAMSGWIPQGSLRGIGGTVASMHNPFLAPAFSPRVVGEATRAVGNTYRSPITQSMIEALRRGIPPAVNASNRTEE